MSGASRFRETYEGDALGLVACNWAGTFQRKNLLRGGIIDGGPSPAMRSKKMSARTLSSVPNVKKPSGFVMKYVAGKNLYLQLGEGGKPRGRNGCH